MEGLVRSQMQSCLFSGMILHAASEARATFLCSMCTLSVWPQPEPIKKTPVIFSALHSVAQARQDLKRLNCRREVSKDNERHMS